MEKKTKKCLIWLAILLLVLIIAAAITVTLVLVLKKKPAENDSGPTLDDIISDNSTFPNGSFIISASSLQSDLPALAPLVVNISMLNWLGLRVDNSSMVAETNRLSYFFVRLPAAKTTGSSELHKNFLQRVRSTEETRVKRQAINGEGSIGIRFGNADTIHVIPLNLSATLNSGLSFVGFLPDDSQVYQVEVRMSNAMCSQGSAGSCSSVNWTPYSISSATSGSQATFTNELPVACGSQCNADVNSPCATSCSTCDGQVVAGADTPVTRRYKMGTFAAQMIQFAYETYVVRDRVTVSYEGSPIFDSGCVGTDGEKVSPISFSGNSLELRVDVEPNCMGTTSTGWYFQLPCADCQGCQEYQCLEDSKAHCGPDGYLTNYALYYCKRYYEYYDKFTPAGQQFIDCVRVDLLAFIENYLAVIPEGSVDCTDLYNKAFDSHVMIYFECGFCDVFCDNKIAFFKVLGPALVHSLTWYDGALEMVGCQSFKWGGAWCPST